MSLTERDIVLAAVKAQMKHATDEMAAELSRAYYRDATMLNTIKPKKLSVWKYRYYMVRSYFITLWKAIKGVELMEEDDYS